MLLSDTVKTLDLKKTLSLAFSQTLFKSGFSTLQYYNLAWDVPIHTRFDGLDLVLRLHVCQNHQQQFIKQKFLFTVV